jgi:arylsulfatase A-like enzyme
MKKVNRGRRIFLGGTAAVGMGLAGYSAARRPSSPVRANLKSDGKKLNVLLIVTDQERAWDFLPAGFIDTHCPGRKALRDESVYFSRAHAPSQFCSMARAIIYSGSHPRRNGLWDNVPLPYASDLRHDVPTLGTMFQDAGYTTAYFGKWHLSRLGVRNGPVHTPEKLREEFASYGFAETDNQEEFDGALRGFEDDAKHAIGAAKFFERNKGAQKPWFAAVNIVNPHDIMYYTTGDEMTRGRKIQFPDRSTRPPDTPLYNKNLGYGLQPNYSVYSHDTKATPHAVHEFKLMMDTVLGEIDYSNEKFGLEFQNYYYNCIRDSDQHIAHILNALAASGHADNTVVALVSDHGEMLGARGLRGKGTTAYREGTNVPLAVRMPGGQRGVVSNTNVSQVDIAPTLLSLAGIKLSDAQEAYGTLVGRDFSAAVFDAKHQGQRQKDGTLLHWTALAFQDHVSAVAVDKLRLAKKANPMRVFMLEEVQTATTRRGQMRAIVDEQYKFVRYFTPRTHHVPHTFEDLLKYNDLELFDMHADPMERNNLAANPEKNRELITLLNAKLNVLIAAEMGKDDGAYMPGPGLLWNA